MIRFPEYISWYKAEFNNQGHNKREAQNQRSVLLSFRSTFI